MCVKHHFLSVCIKYFVDNILSIKIFLLPNKPILHQMGLSMSNGFQTIPSPHVHRSSDQ
jgi:hypothetical protein